MQRSRYTPLSGPGCIRLADMRLGLLINFGATRIKDGITRLVNGLEES